VKLLRIILAVAICSGSLFLLGRLCYEPHVCNVTLARVRRQTERAVEAASDDRGALIARANLDRLRNCRPAGSQVVESKMLKGANYRALQRTAEAINSYEEALEWDRRPEIYLNLGVTYLDKGARAKAIDSLSASGYFNPYIINEVQDVIVREKVRVIISTTTDTGRGTFERILSALRQGRKL